jgi:hypothetical protein
LDFDVACCRFFLSFLFPVSSSQTTSTRPPALEPSNSSSNSGWVQLVDSEGVTYYDHPERKETQWSRPVDMDGGGGGEGVPAPAVAMVPEVERGEDAFARSGATD